MEAYGKNLTERELGKALRSGEVLAAAPDPSYRIRFFYKDGIRRAFVKKTDGGLKVYSSVSQCWQVIERIKEGSTTS